MTRKPDSLETMRIALELLRRIPRRRKVSASELHSQLADAGLKRDIRTIQRQLDALSEQFDIERDAESKPYGYRWKEKAEGISLPNLTAQESLLLLLAKQHLESLLPARLMKSMDAFFNQASRNLDTTSSAKKEREWLEKVRVVSTTQPLLPPSVEPGILEAVSEALYENRWLSIEYRNASGTQTEADVMPLGLAQQDNRLYLVCRFRGYENERSLAVHRLVTAKTQTTSFKRPRDFSLAKYDADGRFGFGDGEIIKLTFCIDSESGYHLQESKLSDDQAIRDKGDYFEVAATVIDSSQLDWWLNGFGESIWNIDKKSTSSKTNS